MLVNLEGILGAHMDGPDLCVLLMSVFMQGSWGGMLGVADFSALFLHKAPGLLLADYILND